MSLRDIDFTIPSKYLSNKNLPATENSFSYVYIANIPKQYRSADLRSYFQTLIEIEAFCCFHFRHRKASFSLKQPKECIVNEKDVPDKNNDKYLTDNSKNDESCCCVVKIYDKFLADLSKYHGRSWKGKNPAAPIKKVYIKKLNILRCNETMSSFKNKSELKVELHTDDQTLYEKDFKSMIELNPPEEVMPNGNVGTPTKHFHKLIKQCKLPCSVMKSLGIVFPKNRFNKKVYSQVEMSYDELNIKKAGFSESNQLSCDEVNRTKINCNADLSENNTEHKDIPSENCLSKSNVNKKDIFHESCLSKNNANQNGALCETCLSIKNIKHKNISSEIWLPENNVDCINICGNAGCERMEDAHLDIAENQSNLGISTNCANKLIDRSALAPRLSSDSLNALQCSGESDTAEDADAEDWERYEALHDDVDNQARPKAKDRLFEEDIELKWEKGGSGLVFYTDAYFWNEMKGKDFDEDTVDDWDVDYSVYYEDGAGDKSARDQLQMRIEQRRRVGKEDGPKKFSEIRRKEKQCKQNMNKFAEFEKHSKGFGSRILKKQGWKEGSGVGSLRQGIVEPIDPQGQKKPRDRVGLGFFGEKLDHTVNLKRKAERDVYISTIYDDKDGEEMNAMRYHGKELLKYRPQPVRFEKK